MICVYNLKLENPGLINIMMSLERSPSAGTIISSLSTGSSGGLPLCEGETYYRGRRLTQMGSY